MAVRVTATSAGKVSAQVAPQSIPAGVLTTVPLALAATLSFGTGSNSAMHALVAETMLILMVPSRQSRSSR